MCLELFADIWYYIQAFTAIGGKNYNVIWVSVYIN